MSFKTFLKVFGLAAAGIALTVLLLGFFYGDDVKQLLLSNINRNLNTEIQVEKINFSILSHFPFASVELENVMAKDAIQQAEKDTLLKAQKISLLFNLMGIFSKDVSIKKIILKNAMVNIRVDEGGQPNYRFWKSSGDSSGSVVDLQNVVLDNVKISYLNRKDDQRYIFNSVDGTLRGKFSDKQFELKTDAELVVEHFYAGKTDYAANKKVKLNSILKVDNDTHRYEFGQSKLSIEDLLFDVSGNVFEQGETAKLDLHVQSHEADLHDLLSLLPASVTAYFSGFATSGKFTFQSVISGNATFPDLKFSFSLSDGSLNPKGSNVMLSHLALGGTVERSAAKPSELVIHSFNGMLNGRAIGGNLSVRDFENPFLTLFTKADIDLNSMRAFIKHDTLESLSGTMKLNVSFAGKIKDLKQYASAGTYESDASGTIVLEEVSLKLKQNPLEYKNINGKFLLHDNNVEVETLDGKISSTDFHLTGSLKNFITFLLIPNQEANMSIAVSSSLIDLNEILENKSVTDDQDTSYKIKINPRLVCNLNVSAEKLIFRKFEALNIRGSIHIEDQVITSPNLTFKAMEGNVAMSANIATGRRDSIFMGCHARISSLNITQLFTEMENFGEQTVTDQNLKGKVTADVNFSSSWTKDLTIDPSKVVAEADLTIDNGELNNFKPILSLSKYLKLADLRQIRFSQLKNLIHIRDRKIFFPTMDIQSSALNLNASGTHDFDNVVDYKLNMLLSDVLGKKMKDQQTEFGTIEDDGLGHTRLFLSMKGPVDNPKFSYDSKSVSRKIAQDLKTDRHQVKQMLQQEFGVFRKDTSLKEQKKKREEMQIDWEESSEKN